MFGKTFCSLESPNASEGRREVDGWPQVDARFGLIGSLSANEDKVLSSDSYAGGNSSNVSVRGLPGARLRRLPGDAALSNIIIGRAVSTWGRERTP